jgi:hypothetical protein
MLGANAAVAANEALVILPVNEPLNDPSNEPEAKSGKYKISSSAE